MGFLSSARIRAVRIAAIGRLTAWAATVPSGSAKTSAVGSRTPGGRTPQRRHSWAPKHFPRGARSAPHAAGRLSSDMGLTGISMAVRIIPPARALRKNLRERTGRRKYDRLRQRGGADEVRPLADRIGRADNCDGAVSLLSHMGYRPTANRSLHKRPANARQFDDLTAALARSGGLIPDLTDGHIARPPFAADRAVAGQRMEKGGSGNPTVTVASWPPMRTGEEWPSSASCERVRRCRDGRCVS